MIHATLSYVVTGFSDLYPIICSLLPPLNEKNLPWIDVIHPIVVHFVIAFSSGAVFRVMCTDWSKKMKFKDELRVVINSVKFSNYLRSL